MKLIITSLISFCLFSTGWLRADPIISYDYPYPGSFIINHETSPLMYSGVLEDSKSLIDYLLVEQQHTDHFIHQHYADFHRILLALASTREQTFQTSETPSQPVEIPVSSDSFVFDVVFDERHPCGRVFFAREPCLRCDRTFIEIVENRTEDDRLDHIDYDVLFEGDSEHCIIQWSSNGHYLLLLVEKDDKKQLLRLNPATKQETHIQTPGINLDKQGRLCFINHDYGHYIEIENSAAKTTYHLQNDSDELDLIMRETIEVMENAEITVLEEQVTATDGTEISVTIVGLSDVIESLGKHPVPMVLSVYGGYGRINEPVYNPVYSYLISQGITVAYAHVRGGGKPDATDQESREWQNAGQYLNLKTGFQDYIDVAKGLISKRITASDRLIATGTSWGGMNAGYAINQHPTLFAGAVLKVPSVEPRLTMYESDWRYCRVKGMGSVVRGSTVCVYESFNNYRPTPETMLLEEELVYNISPYENIRKGSYPHLLVTTGLKDVNVSPWEPARYHNKLKRFSESGNHLFLYSEMEGDHFFRSDRQNAFEVLFVLDILDKL
ncbi:prolyl oligopeptidase family serine peptidase [Endozoicomonas numazuensis]|uniref:Peptidase S9 prolyl oligopeptidase catalytic domain-containing protein n=1 Tax=Endozoicomonas numazuensis TaxID=1137799 RepID=A0A081NEZ3_9GAMM|nr:prolyl oligopeptidase family serine peptidase [Endozoicomonas numazuensis]KEQ17016.1 hypothetical protein GZ78_20595 [Endozoicomonas numazuensis]